MSQKVQILRSVVEQRLTVAVEEIFGLFERTIAEYEEELCRTKEENHRQRQILDSVWNPRVHIHKTDVQQLLVVKEDVPLEQQEWNPIVDQEEPEPPHIKEEQEELWTCQEVNITKFPSTPVPVKREEDDDDEKKCQSSQLSQTQTEENKIEANEVGCGGSEPSSSFHPQRHLRRKTDGDDGGGSDPDINLVHMESVKRRTFDSKSLLEEHMDTHTGQKLVGSSECEATFSQMKNTTQETKSPRDTMKKNNGKNKLCHCYFCSKTFSCKSHLEIHLRIHTGEKPFCCSVCGSRFTQKSTLHSHMMSHTGQKPFKCSLCHKCFKNRGELRRHMRVHTGEKPYGCSECGRRFTQSTTLKSHMRLHTGERPYICTECGKTFTQNSSLKSHMKVHTGERPFSCGVCQKRFTCKVNFRIHLRMHMRRDRISDSQESDQQNLRNNDTGEC